MRAVVQRVKTATVLVDEEVVGETGKGLLVFLGVGEGDQSGDAEYLASKVANLRIFSDSNDKMNLSLLEISGEALVVSQLACPDTSGHTRNADLTLVCHGGRCPDVLGPASALRLGHGKRKDTPMPIHQVVSKG